MNSTLLLRLVGPMQSWGSQSRFDDRDTGLEPTKSGVLGLVCAAMGIPRGDDAALSRLVSLWMGVRVDREGVMSRDYQTVGGGTWPGEKWYGVIKADGSAGKPVVTTRHYLSDAGFLVALAGAREVLQEVHAALRDPVWPLFLGRKAFAPSEPVWLPEGVIDMAPEEVLRTYSCIAEPRARLRAGDQDLRLRAVLECEAGQGQPRMDQPVSFELNRRRFAVRYVKTGWIDGTKLVSCDRPGFGDEEVVEDVPFETAAESV